MKNVIILIIGVLLLGCSDIKAVEFKDLAAVKSARAIEKGWIPPWLANTAFDIKEAHNLDTNKSILSWKYKIEEKWQVPANCSQINPFDAPAPAIKRSWWPSDVPASRYSTYRHVFHSCGDMTFLAILPSAGEALFWRN